MTDLKFGKLLSFFWVLLSLADDVEEVVCENEGNTLPVDAELLLEVTQEVAEVNVEDPTIVAHLETPKL